MFLTFCVLIIHMESLIIMKLVCLVFYNIKFQNVRNLVKIVLHFTLSNMVPLINRR